MMARTEANALTKRFKRKDGMSEAFIYILVFSICLITILPVLQVVTISLSPNEIVGRYGLHLIPFKISLEGYRKVLSYNLIWNSYVNTIIRTILGMVISVSLYILGGYPLSKKELPNRRFWTLIVLFTMYFSGGLIPSYILITKYLNLTNTIWSMVLPPAVNAYTLIIARNFFESIPDSLEESARIDGASEFRVLVSIIIPLSKPVIATISLWSLVFHWNAWLDCMLYITDQGKYVLQMVLRQILLMGQIQDMNVITTVNVNNDTMKMATLVVSVIPIIAIYPFLQKYFVKGVLVGAVKG